MSLLDLNPKINNDSRGPCLEFVNHITDMKLRLAAGLLPEVQFIEAVSCEIGRH